MDNKTARRTGQAPVAFSATPSYQPFDAIEGEQSVRRVCLAQTGTGGDHPPVPVAFFLPASSCWPRSSRIPSPVSPLPSLYFLLSTSSMHRVGHRMRETVGGHRALDQRVQITFRIIERAGDDRAE